MTDYDKLPTKKEFEMRHKIKLLQSKLRYRELKLKKNSNSKSFKEER